MTFIRSLIGFLAIALIIISCKKEHSIEDAELPVPEEASWEFKESGKLFGGPMDSAFFQSLGPVTTLSLVGTSSGEVSGDIFMQIVGENITTGTYTNPLVFFQYSENSTVIYQSVPTETGDFSIIITYMDSSRVAGTYSGIVQGQDGNYIITEGKFNTYLSSQVDNPDPDPVETGQLTVWAKEICSDGGSIEVNINGQSALITDGMPSEPECGAGGAASFTLLFGEYIVEAICGNDTLRYNVTISDECSLLEVDFQTPPDLNDYLPLNEGSYWDYNDLSDPGVVQRITAGNKEVMDGREYTKMTSDLGDVFYYRKEQNAYYQFRVLDFQGSVSNPPSIEVPILYDNLNAGDSWEISGIDITLSGIGVKLKLVYSITRRDYTDTYNGVEYPDLIEVKTDIHFSSDGGVNYQSAESSYYTVFAYGRGIVFYDDLDRSIGWGINGFSLNP